MQERHRRPVIRIGGEIRQKLVDVPAPARSITHGTSNVTGARRKPIEPEALRIVDEHDRCGSGSGQTRSGAGHEGGGQSPVYGSVTRSSWLPSRSENRVSGWSTYEGRRRSTPGGNLAGQHRRHGRGSRAGDRRVVSIPGRARRPDGRSWDTSSPIDLSARRRAARRWATRPAPPSRRWGGSAFPSRLGRAGCGTGGEHHGRDWREQEQQLEGEDRTGPGQVSEPHLACHGERRS